MPKRKTIVLSLIASLVVLSGCGGDFCDLYTPIYFPGEVAEAVVTGARAEAEQLDAMNATHTAICP